MFVQMNTLWLLTWLLTHKVLFEVLGGMLTSIDVGLFYLLRQSNRYPCNQICYAKGAFKSQTLYKPNLYKWASFVHRTKYICSICCCILSGCGGTNVPRWKWASTQTYIQHSVYLCFFDFYPPLNFSLHTLTQPGPMLFNLLIKPLCDSRDREGRGR